MLSSRDIGVLLNLKTLAPHVVSLYLELGGDRDPHREAGALLNESLQKDPLLQGLDEDIARISAFIKSFTPRSEQGLAVFSSYRHGLWQTAPLPQKVKSLIRVDSRPYLNPLVNILDQYRRYGVVLLDERKARFIEIYLNGADEAEEIDVPASQGRHARLKAVADRLMSFVRSRAIERVILGTAPELEAPFMSHLHSFIQNNLILDSQLRPETPLQTVLEKVVDAEKQSRIVLESVLVHRLLDTVRRAGMGVVGLQNTLAALQRGQIRMLILKDSLSKLGRSCMRCRTLSLSGRKCAACGSLTESVFNLVQEIVQGALDQNCEVFRIFHDRGMDAFGGIGAELRFKNEPSPSPAASFGSKMI